MKYFFKSIIFSDTLLNMKKSLTTLEQISQNLNRHETFYKFNTQNKNLSQKYRKGRISAAQWLNELIFYFIKKESNFICEFKTHIQEQKKKLSTLENSEYKNGLLDELNTIEEMLDDRNHNN